MTDRFCIARFAELTIPRRRASSGADLHRQPRAGQAGGDIVEVVWPTPTCAARARAGSASAPSTRSARPPSRSTPQEKLYHCFGCGVGGDTIKFVEEKEGLDFADAVELLAERYGVELEREKEDPQAEARRAQRRRLRGAARPHRRLLRRAYLWDSEEAGKAREYLAGRGLGEEVLRAFGVGYAPSAWDQVLMRGQRAGFKIEELRGVGLAQRGRSGGEYDRFRERIMFPIRDRARPGARLRRPGDALRPGRQVRQHGGDRLLPQERDALRDRRGEERRSRRRAGRSWSRDTPTCWPCTRPGSRRRSG